MNLPRTLSRLAVVAALAAAAGVALAQAAPPPAPPPLPQLEPLPEIPPPLPPGIAGDAELEPQVTISGRTPRRSRRRASTAGSSG